MSARLLLIGGLILGASAIAIAGLVDSFWVFVAMFGVLGLANTVYHPADYALLSQHVAAARAGRVFSFHTFAGMAGNAVTPPTLLFLYSIVGWRGAYLAAAVLGLVAAAVLVWVGEPETPAHACCRNAARSSGSRS
jgi:sugar phosphate permease